ncbi:copper resistance protein NlpE [Capnocytophaga sp. oral taxon 864]|uniref:copper resistance protein NlpE n=1 Tax=Capnocytophaga sp. oral taxon 864 TaxID=1316593 RepID=UPI000D02F427|nr:copper resistance protein NlpE [Capnocytophaga sp. oral taxon 864]AVM54341.1 copper resistance protein NlpE [Capnocytophaga sp. oral taxon 864]
MKKMLLIFSVIALFLTACNRSYIGTYEGVLPCADCSGNHITLVIDKDSYTSKESSEKGSFEDKGTVDYNAENQVLTLISSTYKDSKSFYRVKDNSLIMLDQEGNDITNTELTADYTLKKAN